jgi:hydrogenase maturation protein HypF
VDPKNRRFHAQTTVCSGCGPSYQVAFSRFADLDSDIDPWIAWKRTIENHGLVALLSQSGSYFVCDASSSEAVLKLRRLKRKSNKPLAVMVKDVSSAKKYAILTDQDVEHLMSVRKPIVIVPTNQMLSTLISPGLKSIGIMLPYTSFHLKMFEETSLDVLVVTSANPPNQPMSISKDRLERFGKETADLVITHDLPIIQRVDDSVIQSHGDHHHILRRSRGYAPQPYYLPSTLSGEPTIALGAEEMNTISILADRAVISSQHIGHITNNEMLESQLDAVNHLLSLFPINPSQILIDLHPNFLSRINADILSDKLQADVQPVQHHVAHAASLALDTQMDTPILNWSVDGFGYGDDGQAWGGELLFLDQGYQRLGNLKPIRYDGGDINAQYPDRMLYFLSEGDLPFNWKFARGAMEEKYLRRSLIAGSPLYVLS